MLNLCLLYVNIYMISLLEYFFLRGILMISVLEKSRDWIRFVEIGNSFYYFS